MIQRLIMTRRCLVCIALLLGNGSFCGYLSSGCIPCVHAEEAKAESVRITAMEPAALTADNKETLKLRGFALKGATALSFPSVAEGIAAIKETKDASQAKGLESKQVGDTQLDAEVTLPKGMATAAIEFVVVTPAGEATGKIMVVAKDTLVDEKEPNDGFRAAQSLTVGQFARGNLHGDKDVDVFAVSAFANQRFKISVTSGGTLLADLELNAYDAHGQWLGSADDNGDSRDPILTLQCKSDGVVYLSVSGAHDLGGPWHSYLLAVEEAK